MPLWASSNHNEAQSSPSPPRMFSWRLLVPQRSVLFYSYLVIWLKTKSFSVLLIERLQGARKTNTQNSLLELEQQLCVLRLLCCRRSQVVSEWGGWWLVGRDGLPCWTERAPVWAYPSGTPGRVVWTASSCLSSSVEPVGSPIHAGASEEGRRQEWKNKKQKTYLQWHYSNNMHKPSTFTRLFLLSHQLLLATQGNSLQVINQLTVQLENDCFNISSSQREWKS